MSHSVASLVRAAWQDLIQHRREICILAYVAAAVTVVEYAFLQFRFRYFFPDLARLAADPSQAQWWHVLLPQAWWSLGTFFCWVAVPLIAAKALGIKPSALGLSRGLLAGTWRIYALLFLIMLPAVFWASTQAGFVSTYPLIRPQQAAQWTWTVLLLYWALYGLQFLAVEFFFRGFITFSLEKQFGLSVIAISAVPYCMIHFHKPMPEALGAIGAGLLLGWLRYALAVFGAAWPCILRSRSVWIGCRFCDLGYCLSHNLWLSKNRPHSQL